MSGELTNEEKKYYDKFTVVFKKYGEDIPDAEWMKLSKVREELGIGLQRSKEIIKLVQHDVEKLKFEAANPTKVLATIGADVNEDNIIDQHPRLQQKREKNLAEYKEKAAKLEACKEEKKNLKAPVPVSDPGKVNYVKVLIWYAIAIATWHFYGLGIVIFIIETLIVWNHQKGRKKFEEYTNEHEKFLKTKERLKNEIPQLEMDVEYLQASIPASLYAEVNNGCSIPISREFVNADNWERISKKLDVLVRLLDKYKQANETDKREHSLKYFDMKLLFFYEESLKGETTARVYNTYQTQLNEARNKQDMNVLRHDSQEGKLLAVGEYEFADEVDRFKFTLERMNMEEALSRYESVKNLKTTGNWGFTDIDRLAGKTEELRTVYHHVKIEYEKLQKVSEKVNFILTYVRSIAYRNIYLGVELLNFIRDNAGGKKLMSQKDKVVTENVLGVANFDAGQLRMDSSANISSSLGGLAQAALQDKDVMKFAMKNPKMAAGAAALTVIGNLIGERVEKIDNNVELQKQFIDSIGKMVDGYNSGKAGLLRAIEIIKALSKANIGFLAIYAPLRDKFFVDGCTEASMLDLQNLAKATQEYKHISDTKL